MFQQNIFRNIRKFLWSQLPFFLCKYEKCTPPPPPVISPCHLIHRQPPSPRMAFLQFHPATISLFPLDNRLPHPNAQSKPSRDGWAAQFEGLVWAEVAKVRAQRPFRAQKGHPICFSLSHLLKARWAQRRSPTNCPIPTDLWYGHHLHYTVQIFVVSMIFFFK